MIRVEVADHDGVDLVSADALGVQARIGRDTAVDQDAPVRFANQEGRLPSPAGAERVARPDEVEFDHLRPTNE